MKIETMLVDGWRPVEIIDMMAASDGLNTKQVTRFIADIRKTWASAEVENPGALKMKYIERLEKLYRLSVMDKQYGTAVKIQDVINRMVALYQTEVAQEER
ncbi:MAG TPA: hypothetical protein VGB67_11220, partial [Fibrella sp.]